MPGNKNKRTVTMFYLWNTYFLRISAMCALLCLPTPPMTAKVCNSLTQHHILCNFYKHQQKACHKKNIISPPPKKKAVHSFDQFCWSESFLCQRMVWWVMLFVTCLGTYKKRRSWSELLFLFYLAPLCGHIHISQSFHCIRNDSQRKSHSVKHRYHCKGLKSQISMMYTINKITL